jgi:hypothetical protein
MRGKCCKFRRIGNLSLNNRLIDTWHYYQEREIKDNILDI